MKRIFAFLMSIVMILGLCACQVDKNPTDTTLITVAPTTEVVETTDEVSTDPTDVVDETTEVVDLLAAAEAKLAQYAVEYDWIDGVINVILTNVPDFEMFDNITLNEDGVYIITMTDGLQYSFFMYEDGIGDITLITE